MPQIIVTADASNPDGGQAVLLTERVSVQDFESDHFQSQLVERIGWAVGDAHELEQQTDEPVADDAPVAGYESADELAQERTTAALPAS